MKICILTTRHTPVDDRIYYKETLSLARTYPDLVLVAPLPDSEAAPVLDPSVRFVRLPVRKGLLGRIPPVLTIVRLLRSLRVDVCHFHDFDLVLAAPFLRLFTKARLIYDSHEAYPMSALVSPHLPSALRRPASVLVDLLEKNCARLCDLIIAADDPTAKSFERTGVPILAILNFPRLSLFKRRTELESQLIEKYRGRLPVIYQGSASADRGLFHMIKAMKTVTAQEGRALLLLVGLTDETLQEEVHRLSSQLGVRSAVEIIPWVDHTDVGSYLRISKIGLIPFQPREKYKQNLPIKLFEYMACELPVLCADLPSLVPYVEPPRSGRVYDATSVEKLATHILDMLHKDDERAELGANGRRAIEQSWNWGKMEELLLSAYADLESRLSARRSKRAGSNHGTLV